jgi:MFS family permease
MNIFLIFFILLIIIGFINRIMINKDVMEKEKMENLSKQNFKNFKKFQLNYLFIYLLVMSADWLQGPYVYILYESYGFKKEEIAKLFISGSVSSLIFGTFLGSLADKYGRKFLCLLFGFIYSFACLTTLKNNFYILLIGRICSGIATSILFSCFESWMISEHINQGYSINLLSNTFSKTTFGNGIIAILAGLIASISADLWGYTSPFLISMFLLLFATLIIEFQWKENYGDSSISLLEIFSNAMKEIKNNIQIIILGLIQSFFEASMYTFVFLWTPVLLEISKINNFNQNLPYGLIFACFMVSIMIGSSIYEILYQKYQLYLENILAFLLFFSSISLFIPIFTQNLILVFIFFLIFEINCGIYFPCMSSLRGKYIPEQTRSIIMNFFRIPLNILVIIVLLKVNSLEYSTIFFICFLWLIISFFLTYKLKSILIKNTLIVR